MGLKREIIDVGIDVFDLNRTPWLRTMLWRIVSPFSFFFRFFFNQDAGRREEKVTYRISGSVIRTNMVKRETKLPTLHDPNAKGKCSNAIYILSDSISVGTNCISSEFNVSGLSVGEVIILHSINGSTAEKITKNGVVDNKTSLE